MVLTTSPLFVSLILTETVDMYDSATTRPFVQFPKVHGTAESWSRGICEQMPVGNVVLFNDARPAVCSNFVARMPVAPDCDSRYVSYVFRALYSEGKNVPHIKQTSGIQNLDSESYLNERAWLPGKPEQVRIANFLDDKTARIDALIAEKVRLITLLAEQRSSISERVISNTASGKRAKLGLFVDLLPGYAFPSDDFSRDVSDIPLLRGVNVSPEGIRWDDNVYWSRAYDESLERFKLQVGDVVFGMDRPWISSGARVAMVDEASEGAFLLQRVCRLRGGKSLRQRFIFYALSSNEFRQSVEVDLTGVSVPHISPEQVLGFKVPVLSPGEQDSRLNEADAEIGRIHLLEAQTTEMLARLREYRSSLISAAVTGQLDVGAFKEAA
jgi:type I restriction enzyme S subunit